MAVCFVAHCSSVLRRLENSSRRFLSISFCGRRCALSHMLPNRRSFYALCNFNISTEYSCVLAGDCDGTSMNQEITTAQVAAGRHILAPTPLIRMLAKMKGLIVKKSVLGLLCVLPLLLPTTGWGQFFADSGPAGSALDSATSTMYQMGITAGCGSSPLDFCPTQNLARDQMAVFLVRAWSINLWGSATAFMTFAPPNTTTPYFQDVLVTDPYFNFVQKLYELGITGGFAAPTFVGGVVSTRGTYCPNTTDNGHGVSPARARAGWKIISSQSLSLARAR